MLTCHAADAGYVVFVPLVELGPITAIVGAGQLRAMHAPPALLLPTLTAMSAWLDFLIASASAKWTAMAPVAAPMLMLLGISPEMTTAAYRVGDTVTNLISPLNAYFVLTLTFCRRWIPDFRLGSLLALLLPLSIAFFLGGAILTAIWVALEIPVGPGAAVSDVIARSGALNRSVARQIGSVLASLRGVNYFRPIGTRLRLGCDRWTGSAECRSRRAPDRGQSHFYN